MTSSLKCHSCGSVYNQIAERVFQCNQCDHIYRKYNGDNLLFHEKSYRNNDTRFMRHNKEYNSDGSLNENFHTARHNIVTQRHKKILKYLDNNLTFFDIGAGAGTFLKQIKSDVAQISGNELDIKLINEMDKFCDQTIKGDFLAIDIPNSYDLVSAWHVLEHIENIDHFLNKVHSMVDKYFFVEIPTLKSYYTKTRTRELISPTTNNWDGHVHYFSKQSLEIYLNKKFDVILMSEGVQSPAIFSIAKKKEH